MPRRPDRLHAAGASLRLASVVLSLGMAAATVLGVTACKTETEHEAAAHTPVRLGGERYRVDLFPDDHALGGEQPLVTVVIFTDYSCPPCGRTWQVMDNLVEDYGPDLRVVFRAYTVQSLPRSERAAEAVHAAGAQGKFWEMHRRLFEQGSDYDRPTLRAHAEALGLDVARFLDDLDTGAHAGTRVRHRRQAKDLGVVGLPAAFVNGKYMAGYADEPTWHGVIDEEIRSARELIQQGTPRAELYAAMMRDASTRPVGAAPGEQALRKKLDDQAASGVDVKNLRPPDARERYAVRVGELPATGSADAPVEVVMFMDFRCPYCRRAWQQEVGVLVRSQPDGVRLGVRQLPLEFHPSAKGAAVAALAAERQGHFWAMFDRLVEHDPNTSLGRSDFVAYAEQLGMDTERFVRDLGDPALAKQVEDDIDLANRLGISGTPGFFVNGRYFSGFVPGVITGMVEEEQAAAQAVIDAGTPAAEAVDALMAEAIPESEFPNR